MSNEHRAYDTPEDAEIAVRAAEREKFLAEAAELNRPLIQRPGFWGALLPGGAAIFTAYIAITSQVFEAADDRAAAALERARAELSRVESEKTLLDAQTIEAEFATARAREDLEQAQEAFRVRTEELEATFAARETELRDQEAALEATVSDLEARETALIETEAKLQQSIADLQQQVIDEPLNAEIRAFAASPPKVRDGALDALRDGYFAHPDPARAQELVLAAAEAHDADFAIWSQLLLVAHGDEPPRPIYDMLISRADAALANGVAFAADFRALSLLGLDETPEDFARRCQIFETLAAMPSITDPDESFVYLSRCVREGRFNPLPEAQSRSIAATVLEVAAAQIASNNPDFEMLSVLRAAEVIGSIDPHVADLVLARHLARRSFDIDGIDQFFLDDYIEQHFTQVVNGLRPTTTVGSGDMADWESFWAEHEADYVMAALADRLRGN